MLYVKSQPNQNFRVWTKSDLVDARGDVATEGLWNLVDRTFRKEETARKYGETLASKMERVSRSFKKAGLKYPELQFRVEQQWTEFYEVWLPESSDPILEPDETLITRKKWRVVLEGHVVDYGFRKQERAQECASKIPGAEVERLFTTTSPVWVPLTSS